MGYIYYNRDKFDKFSGDICWIEHNKFSISLRNIPVISKDYYNPLFEKYEQGIYIEYKWYGPDSLHEKRRMTYRKYISIEDELQTALNNTLGFEFEIVDVMVVSSGKMIVITCKEDEKTNKLFQFKNQVRELNFNIYMLENTNRILISKLDNALHYINEIKNDLEEISFSRLYNISHNIEKTKDFIEKIKQEYQSDKDDE